MARTATVFSLLTGLAVGFAVGREVGGCQRGGRPSAVAGARTVDDVVPARPGGADDAAQPAPEPQPPAGEPLPPAAEPEATALPLARHNARRGTTGAKATIVEFIDFLSPASKAIAPTLHRLRDRYPTELAVVVKQLPGDEDGPAMTAALAMQAAFRQRKHWEMHDKMLASQTALAPDDLERYAAELGLDVEQFKRDMADPIVRQEVDADRAVARQVVATPAPSFFVNCRKVEAPHSAEVFQQVIDPEIARANQLRVAGVPEEELYQHLCKK